MLYLPPQVWLLPLGVLIPAALVFDRRLLAVLVCCCLLVVFGFAGFRLRYGVSKPTGANALTVLTNNIGQSNHQSMASFVEQEKPDFIVLQDAVGRSPYYRRAYPNWSVAAVGEFVLISRFPVRSAKPIKVPSWRGPVAAVFSVDWPVQPITLYAVHLPTPRPDFLRLRGRGFLFETIRPKGSPWGRFARYNEAMQARVTGAEALVQMIAQEPGPVLVAGDFNMPSWGLVHSMFTSKLKDSFEVAGQGFGFTFPGTTHNPLTLFGPWLRLDYLFCNQEWTPVLSRVEPHRASQHRAVAATFEWHGDGH